MLIIGLTGGIGSGKTTVANLFAQKEVPIIDADIIAREITQPNMQATIAILNHFEENLCRDDGSLDRLKLRNIIFKDLQERQWLERLLHPLIRVEIQTKIDNIKNKPYCIVVIPLLFESEPFPFLHRVLVVDTTESLQISRVIARDNTAEEEVKNIMATQVPRSHRKANASDYIMNDGDLDKLASQVDMLHKKYISLSQDNSHFQSN